MSGATLRDRLRARRLLPHQVEFVERALDAKPRGRVLLADDVGLGKTYSCVELARVLAQELWRDPRILVLAPKVLLTQWQSQLGELASMDALVIDPAVYRKLEARTRRDENPWMVAGTVLTTIDLAKQASRLTPLVEAPWDLVIIEEAHLATSRSQRGRALRALWESDRVELMVAVSATPHTGHASDFEPFSLPTTLIIRRRASELRDWDGAPLVPERADPIAEFIPIELSLEEKALYEAVVRLASKSARGGGKHRLFMVQLVRRAMSSFFALDQMVRRCVDNANRFVHSQPLQPGLFGSEPAEYEQVDLFEQDAVLEPSFLVTYRDEFRDLLTLLEQVEIDAKWQACARVLRRRVVESDGSALVFCDYVETAEYLSELLDSFECPVSVITGLGTAADVQREVDAFREDGGVIVVTSAASKGLSFSSVKLCIHYDLPWNRARMEERFGRIHRIGAPPAAVRHVGFTDEIITFERDVRALLSSRDEVSILNDLIGETDVREE